MKYIFTLLLNCIMVLSVSAQHYPGLQRLESETHKVLYSENARERATEIFYHLAKADGFFEELFKVKPDFTLLVLSPADWKKYANPYAIYGMPHLMPDGRLVVAAEFNEFWRRNTPPMEKLGSDHQQLMKATYPMENDQVIVTQMFDLLAIHELGHAYQNQAGMVKQRNWLNELFCNILLHSYLAKHEPSLIPALTVLPRVATENTPKDRLKYTRLEDFDDNYNDLGKNYPDNYGWYQYRYHLLAEKIYDEGGIEVVIQTWNALLAQKEKLNNEALMELIKNNSPVLYKAILEWNQ